MVALCRPMATDAWLTRIEELEGEPKKYTSLTRIANQQWLADMARVDQKDSSTTTPSLTGL